MTSERTPTGGAGPPGREPRKQRKRLGRYVLHNLLGRGGMASVYLGRMVGEGGFERWVAIKKIHEHLLEDGETRKMFLDEARTAARLHHPNLVQVTDFGIEGDQPFLVMEYVSGETLSSILRRCVAVGDHLAIPLAARIVASACDALHYAHELRSKEGEPLELVHRDVSPQNILVTYEGATMVTDFGIAKAAGRLQQTRAGQLKGKTAYMSPEQVLAQPLDRRSDIFSLGIVLFEATLGVRLFRRESDLETLQLVSAAEVPAPRTIDPRYPQTVEAVVLRALQKGPEDRYQTARDMQRDLEQYLSRVGFPVSTTELAELMEALFAGKRAKRQQLMATADTLPAEDISMEIELSPTTLSLPEGIAPQRRPKWPILVATLSLALLAAMTVAVWALLARPGGEPGTDGAAAAPGAGAPSTTDAATDATARLPSTSDQLALLSTPSTDLGTASDGGDSALGRGAPGASDAGEADVGEAASPPTKRPAKRPRQPATSGPPGTISIMARPWCEVFMDGRRVGRTPLIRLPARAGRRTLRLLPMGKGPGRRRVVVVQSGRDTPVSVNLTGD